MTTTGSPAPVSYTHLDVYKRQPQVTLGDMDNNGEINMDDVALLIRYCNNLTDLTDTQKAAAELDGNGELNMDDVALLIRYCNNLLSVFPAQK